MSNRSLIEQALETGGGIFRLMPTWVPRSFCVPGRRLRLHPDDLYALGGNRGGIDERWFSSTTKADNGPLTAHDEGLSYIFVSDKLKITLAEAFDEMGAELLGQDVIDRCGGWVMYSKFFDNMYPLPHHLHQSDEKAAEVSKLGKPEAYYYPAQYNFALDTFPFTFFGLNPGTTQDQVVECLKNFEKGDNKILTLSKAHRLQVDTGWYVPPGVLHAPGTLCTYEPQRASDVFSMWQSLIADYYVVDRALLTAQMPLDKHYDYDYMLSLLDWDANTAPDFVDRFFLPPIPAKPAEAMDGYEEKWITYGSEWFSAKSLTVQPGRTVTVSDPAAYGLICVEGYGAFGPHPIAAPTMIRFGQMTEDEFFVTAEAARAGVSITNRSTTEPLVILKHFNPGNPDMPAKP
ncbi:MAG: hypothetical protein L6Q98_01450 [Anaerolineae bacterium]|nr:hypothetical protein [Anaerolineae bacterium]NUQ04435.1 hypothetical protein [Anaerolineae bacterium]